MDFALILSPSCSSAFFPFIFQHGHPGANVFPSCGSSIWNPNSHKPTAPVWTHPNADRSQPDVHEYENQNTARNFHRHHSLSSPGRRPPVGDMHFGSYNRYDTSPMTTSPDRSTKMIDKSETTNSPIVIHDSPSPSVITISSSSESSNSLDITGGFLFLCLKD